VLQAISPQKNMKKKTLIPVLLLMTIFSYCQTSIIDSKFNLGFEKNKKEVPLNWTNFGSSDYKISIDSTIFKGGRYAATIEFTGKNKDYKALEFVLPNNYQGKKITLSGYLKTENITSGYAGLWMGIEPNIAFDNMEHRGVKGTTGWQKYEITLDLKPFKTNKISIGAILDGNGKMWIDNLSLSIDGKSIEHIAPYTIPAKTDKEFDHGSRIESILLDDSNIQHLKTLGLVWGFLKYYHPNIAKGDYNWDYELFRILPKFQQINNNNERDAILVNWINSLGKFPLNNKSIESSKEIKMKPDLDWISNAKFSEELTSLLLNVKNAERTNEHYYITLFDVGNPSFTNENPYATIKYPDVGYRVLSLYRYWNIIQYYFPYKYLIGEDWKNVLTAFIPKIIAAKNETEYTLTILELIEKVNDTHANVWGNQVLNTYKGLNYAPIKLDFIENKAVVTYFNDDVLGIETGLQIGDVISKINNIPVDSTVKKNLKYTPASNYSTKLRGIARRTLLRTMDTLLNVEYIRNGKTNNKIIKVNAANKSKIWKKEFDHLGDTCFKLINPKIAYLSHSALKGKYMHKIWKTIKNTNGIILDCRYTPFHAPLDSVCNYLYPKQTIHAKSTRGSILTPGLFTFKQSYSSGSENENYYKGKVVILVNENTQSSSEYHVMAYQKAPKAIVLGSTTSAADGQVSPPFYLPGEIMTFITGMGVYYPSGEETQRTGIKIDIEVKPTIIGIKQHRDELIEKAIEIINEQ